MSEKNIHTERIELALKELEHSLNSTIQTKPNETTNHEIAKLSVWKTIKRMVYGILFLSFTWLVGMIGFPALLLHVYTKVASVWTSVSISVLSFSLIWTILTGTITYLIFKKKRISFAVAKWALIPLFIYYSLTFFTVNKLKFKDSKDKEAYHQLHPALRIGLSTLVLVDSDLLITNTQRTKQDYINWGLTPLEQSDHYLNSKTGFVHATDIRTKGRKEWKNKLTELTFKLMGFKTLKHVGTADHLHISIPKK